MLCRITPDTRKDDDVPWSLVLGWANGNPTFLFPGSHQWEFTPPPVASFVTWCPPSTQELLLFHGNLAHYGGATRGEKYLLFLPFQPPNLEVICCRLHFDVFSHLTGKTLAIFHPISFT